MATDEELIGDPASERLATPDVKLSAEELQAVPPMLMGESAPRRLATSNVALSAEGVEGMPPMLQCLQARSLSIGGMPSAESPTFGVACLSGVQTLHHQISVEYTW